MNNILLAFGFAWMIAAAIIGLVIGVGHDGLIERLDRFAKEGNLVAYNEASQKFKSGATVHAHAFLWSVILVLVSFVIPKLPFAPWVDKAIPLVLIFATISWTVAALRVIRPLMALADIIFLFTLIAVAFGLGQSVLLGRG